MNNSYRTFFSNNFKKCYNNKNIFNMYNSSVNSQRFLISFSNKFYMTGLNNIMNIQNFKNNFPMIITGQVTTTELDNETSLQEVLPTNGNIAVNFNAFYMQGIIFIKIDREPVEHLGAVQPRSVGNAKAARID
jgi:hypothetical protein